MKHTSLAGSGNPNAPSPCGIAASGEDSLPRRGGMMLFLMYLFQQLGGANYSEKKTEDISGPGVSFLRALNNSSEVGIPNIEQSSGRTFFSWYGDFAGMLALDNTGQVHNQKYSLAAEVTDTFTQIPRNIRLRMSRTDPLTGTTVTLNGPLVSEETFAESNISIDGSLFLSGANVLKTRIPSDAETTFSIQGDKSLALGLTIVKLP